MLALLALLAVGQLALPGHVAPQRCITQDAALVAVDVHGAAAVVPVERDADSWSNADEEDLDESSVSAEDHDDSDSSRPVRPPAPPLLPPQVLVVS